MKMSINKEYVESYQMDRVKEDAKNFKAMYTDGDILRNFCEQLNDYRPYCADVVYCKVQAFDSGWARGCVTSFCVEMMLEAPYHIYKLRFYVDMSLTVDDRPELVTVEDYKEAC